MGLEVLLGVSDMAAPATEAPEVAEAETGAATGFVLEEMLDIPMLPVSESNSPPTEGDELTTTSGSTKSPVLMSPTVCATINAHTL